MGLISALRELVICIGKQRSQRAMYFSVREGGEIIDEAWRIGTEVYWNQQLTR